MTNTPLFNYCLPSDYQENASNITLDDNNTEQPHYWDKSRVWRSSLHQFAVYKWASSLITRTKARIVTDVGCGYAAKLEWLHRKHPGVSFWGIDQPHAIQLCTEHYRFGKWLSVDLENNPPIPDELADITISSDVIEHLRNPDILLDYLRKITKPCGYIIISTPERDKLRGIGCRHSPNPYHIREWNEYELRTYLEKRGFKIIEHKTLAALKPSFSKFYITKISRRWMKGQSMKYNQAVLIKAQ